MVCRCCVLMGRCPRPLVLPPVSRNDFSSASTLFISEFLCGQLPHYEVENQLVTANGYGLCNDRQSYHFLISPGGDDIFEQTDNISVIESTVVEANEQHCFPDVDASVGVPQATRLKTGTHPIRPRCALAYPIMQPLKWVVHRWKNEHARPVTPHF